MTSVRPYLFTAVLLLGAAATASAQRDLLPLRHPATDALLRAYRYGGIPTFPREHLPITRIEALRFLEEIVADADLPSTIRERAEYYRVELMANVGLAEHAVVIPTRRDSRLVFDDPFGNAPLTGLDYVDTASRTNVALDPVLDGELRMDPEAGERAVILQGGVRLRGTLLDHLGFSGQITNGTIVGDSTIALADPVLGSNYKFALGMSRDVDFATGHLRLDFDNAAVEIGREPMRLGGGEDQSLLIGAPLPSNYDYIRLQARVGRVSFTHLHASILADPTGTFAGPFAEIPPKYFASHLLSVGPFFGVRLSLGEAVIYQGRPFEIGYLNPLNFFKSQEHYLQDRDNSFMYAAMSVAPVEGLFLEGEFMLDDLVFPKIGEGYWGNKTAWRLAFALTSLPLDGVDLSFSWSHLEPYVYSHFNPSNAYIHQGAMLGASGMEPNSRSIQGELAWHPLANLSVRGGLALGKHGANVVNGDTLTRNVGGDIRRTFDSLSSQPVEFLDGTVEETTRISATVEYEPLRNVYLRARAESRAFSDGVVDDKSMQLWLGLRIGAR